MWTVVKSSSSLANNARIYNNTLSTTLKEAGVMCQLTAAQLTTLLFPVVGRQLPMM